MKISTHLLSFLLLGAAIESRSETLEEAWTAALDSHRQVAAAAAYRDAAGYELERAKSARLPQLGVESGYTMLDTAPGFALGNVTTGPVFDDDDFVMAGAKVSVPLYAGGAITSGIEAAEFGATAADRQLATVIQDVRMGVAEHYVAVLRAESAVSVAESYVASLTSHTRDTKNRYELGDVPRNDYLAASVTLADAEQRLLQAKNALDYARFAYNRFLGRPLDTPVTVDPAVSIDGLLPPGALVDELLDVARMNRDELAALGAEVNALERQADHARAASRPQLALTGGYTYLENRFLTEDRFWMAGIALRWNLFDGGQARKQSASLEQRAIARGHDRADLESRIGLEVRRAWNDRGEAQSRLAVAERTVQQAEENLRVVTDRYEAGAGTNADVLDAAALHEQSMSNRDDAKFGLLLARVRLARAAGVL